ncbi:type IV pilus assembly protein PilX [Luteibacter sp. UNC138MFCol5.1]|uniref:pilus assembly PilX family protein n=1 Tax=Luteibacter sp. UNC138MFCol5.1 TaxID=1502774 RepID=UPI0008D86A0C|nr:PilX N-terminal domain-containing pilus assembly protein [Luteibacter sp. UNC138MFCol5.1]SEO62790.1 type IV pilus assembly protein PilX [Luteibacter sp. UNC138MFCol5.1]
MKTIPSRMIVPPPGAQRGVVLVVALIFLLLITILAMAASGTSLMQLRLVGGLRSSQLADFGAESALRGAEWRLWTASNTTPMACTTSGPVCYKYDATITNADVEKFRNAKGWDATASTTYSAGTLTKASTDNTFKLTKDPVYLIEDLGVELPPGSGTQHESGQSAPGTGNTSVDSHVYRITARSTGANDNTVRALETTFAAKAN